MPELPEVETIATSLGPQLVGRRIKAIEKLDWEKMVEAPDLASFRQLLLDRTVLAVYRRAKWLLCTLDEAWTLALHLRMTGSVSVNEASLLPDKHTHLVLSLDNGQNFFFRDIRKFGKVKLLDEIGLTKLNASFGPEPLSPTFNPAYLATQLVRHRATLKPLLLKQKLVAGLGNIYVDEALWLAEIHPLRLANSLEDAEINQLYVAICAVLRQAIAQKGTTLRDYRYGNGQMGENQKQLAVYQQTGLPCARCETLIERLVVAQRATHLCPTCQKAPKGKLSPLSASL